MTKDEIKAWFDCHKEELRPDPPQRFFPDQAIKPIKETIDLAYEMPELELEDIGLWGVYLWMTAEMQHIGLPLRAVTAYVNYAGHNTWTIRELAYEMKVNKNTIVVWFKRMRQAWPQLFTSALALELDAELAIQAEQDKSLLCRIFGGE